MEDKIEVGEYVRTDKGDIFEFGEYFKSGNIDSMTDKYGILYGNQQKCCKKHSKNIIDLIEVGDYVNGEEVIEVRRQNNKIYLMTCYCPQKYIKSEIKSIVSKEQFESIKYKV